jgi:hypothetical protein
VCYEAAQNIPRNTNPIPAEAGFAVSGLKEISWGNLQFLRLARLRGFWYELGTVCKGFVVGENGCGGDVESIVYETELV